MGCKPAIVLALLYLAFMMRPTWAELHVDNAQIDLGEVRSGAPLVHAFEMINDEEHEVEILEARGSCGCLKPQLDKKLIKPGEHAKLTMTINTLGQGAGPHSWTARVRYRIAGQEAELGVAIHATVITEVTVQPAAITLVASGPISETVTVTDLRDKPLTIKAVETSTTGLEARIVSQSRDAQGRWIARLQLDVTECMPSGRHVESLSIYTNDPVYQHLQVPVTVIKMAAQRVSAFPEQVLLQPTSGQSASCVARLHPANEQPLHIAKMEIDDAALKCKWAPGPGQDITVRIQLDAERWTGGDLDTTLRIRFDDPPGEILSVPVRVRKE